MYLRLIDLGQLISNFRSRLFLGRKFKGLARVTGTGTDGAVKNFDACIAATMNIDSFAIKLVTVERVQLATSCCA